MIARGSRRIDPTAPYARGRAVVRVPARRAVPRVAMPVGVDYMQTITDSIGVVDSTSPAATYMQTIIDGIGVVDATTQAATYTQAFVDALGLVDSTSQAATYMQTIIDGIGVVDATTQAAAYAQVLVDALGLLDAVVVDAVTGSPPAPVVPLPPSPPARPFIRARSNTVVGRVVRDRKPGGFVWKAP